MVNETALAPSPPQGLSSEQARRRLESFGPNSVEDRPTPAWRRLAARFWGPLPWMLEATILLTLVLGKDLEAGIIAALLVVNALIGFYQSGRAEAALAALRTRLPLNARVLRDQTWQRVPAANLVPGDIVRIRTGDIAPADLEVLEGEVSVDQSALTGESLPEQVGRQGEVHGSSIVTAGEATGVVTATGAATFFGRTARLVEAARPATHLERVVFSIIRYLVAIDVVLVAAMVVDALWVGAPLSSVAPFALVVLIASVPVALPATFSVSQAVGALELSHSGHGVLVTRLQAVQEAAAMDVLCTDKTGTLTMNRLQLAGARAYPPYRDEEVIRLAALASDAAGQDPIDTALLAAAGPLGDERWERVSLQPFDPSTKRTEALLQRQGRRMVVIKGMPEIVANSASHVPESLQADVEALAASGSRVLAVAAGPPGAPRLAGLVALADAPRPDAKQLVEALHRLGVEVKMVTGDTAATAAAVARQVGIGGALVTGAQLRERPELALAAGIIASVFPEDKYQVVRTLQGAGHVVGMTGDGVNDAPALRQAEVGVAVQSAVDVARAAASMVLTEPGLIDLVAAIPISRSIHQRMLTWTLNKVVKTIQVALFLTVGFFLTRSLVTTPLQIVLLLFANDFVTMSLAVDQVRPSPRPDRWDTRALTAAAATLAIGVVAESFLDLYLARSALHLPLAQVQTLMFTMLVFTGQATVYLVRERCRFWASRPARLLLLATGVDVLAVTAIAVTGIGMAAVPLAYVLGVLGLAAAWMLALDPVKVRVLRRLGFAGAPESRR